MLSAKRTQRLALVALMTPLFGFGLGSDAYAAGACTGAPGASAIQQYCEAVPTAGSKSQHAGEKSSSASTVSSQTAATLNASGSDGAKVEALAGGAPSASSTKSTSSSASSSSKNKKKKSSSGASGTSGGSGGSGSGGGSVAVKDLKVNGPSDPSGSPLKAASHAVASGPTVGGGVVWGLVGVSALGVLGAVFLRRRSGTGNPFDPPADGS